MQPGRALRTRAEVAVLLIICLMTVPYGPLQAPRVAVAQATQSSGSTKADPYSVGIVDDGSGMSSSGSFSYDYAAEAFMGSLNFTGGSFYSVSSSGQTENFTTVQLNLMDEAGSYYYEAQDIAALLILSNGEYQLAFADELWNQSTRGGSMQGTLLQGNGWLTNSSSVELYAYGSNKTYNTTAPFELKEMTETGLSSQGYPFITFYYEFSNTTYSTGWVALDNVTIEDLASYSEFVVGGHAGTSDLTRFENWLTGENLNDAEWVVAGFNVPSWTTYVTKWDATATLQYWNGYGWYSVPSAVTRSYDTAGAVNATEGIYEWWNNGEAYAEQVAWETYPAYLWNVTASASYDAYNTSLIINDTPAGADWVAVLTSPNGNTSDYQVSSGTYVIPLYSAVKGEYSVQMFLYANNELVWSSPEYQFYNELDRTFVNATVVLPAGYYYYVPIPVENTYPNVTFGYYATTSNASVATALLTASEFYDYEKTGDLSGYMLKQQGTMNYDGLLFSPGEYYLVVVSSENYTQVHLYVDVSDNMPEVNETTYVAVYLTIPAETSYTLPLQESTMGSPFNFTFLGVSNQTLSYTAEEVSTGQICLESPLTTFTNLNLTSSPPTFDYALKGLPQGYYSLVITNGHSVPSLVYVTYKIYPQYVDPYLIAQILYKNTFPMGIASYGVSNNSGIPHPYTLSTPGVEGEVNMSSMAAYYANGTQTGNWSGVQLNNVLVIENGDGSSYVYWVQDVAQFNIGGMQMRALDNIWNFTGENANMLSSRVQSNSNGITSLYNGKYYYWAATPYWQYNYPLNFTLTVNASVEQGVGVVIAFGIRILENGSMSNTPLTLVFDRATIIDPDATSANFEVIGNQYTPVGFEPSSRWPGVYYDSELVFCGPWGGLMSSFENLSASLRLLEYNSSLGMYVPFPTYYSFGEDTAESTNDLNSEYLGGGTAHVTVGSLDSIYFSTAQVPRTYEVTFSESGLPSGTAWSVTLNGNTQSSTTSQITFQEPAGTYQYSITAPSDYTASPSSGSVSVSGATTQPITFSQVTYPVTFTESGLPSGTSWSVTLNGATESSTSSSVVFEEPAGSYSFSISAISGYTASPSSGSVSVSGTTSEAITFTKAPLATYPVTFTESGLPSGTSWSVTLNGTTESSTSASITFTEPNGTYPYSVGAVSGYSLSPSSGSLTVKGSAVTQTIAFTPMLYSVTFAESGLPSGTSWSVTLAGLTQSSTTSQITFTVPSGTYSYSISAVSGYTVSPSSGSLTVTGAVSQAATFTKVAPTAYEMTFSESGLPIGSTWSVTLGGATQSSTSSEISFQEPTGAYQYLIGTVSGYVSSPTSGSIELTGNITESVTFTPVVPSTYTVTFAESGLPSGTTWSVTLNGLTESSASWVITFQEPAGSYSLTVNAPSGYTASPSSGSMNVTDSFTQTILFTKASPTTYAITFSESGLPAGATWSVTLNGDVESSSTSQIAFQEPAGTYSYSIASPSGYVASPSTGSLTVSGSLTQDVAFTQVLPSSYQVTFSESGLPSGTSWSVTFNRQMQSSTSSKITFSVTAGTYSYSINPVSGYVPSPSSGSLNVSGSTTQDVSFIPIEYPVTFSETGLPSGTSWSVTLNGVTQSSTSSQITFTEPTSTYSYSISSVSGYVSSPTSGSVSVSGSTTESVAFTQVSLPQSYPISFTASGLPAGSTWSVTLNGATKSSTGKNITFEEPAGSYSYSVTLPGGYKAANLTGTISATRSVTVPITAAPSTVVSSPTQAFTTVLVLVVAISALGIVLLLMKKRARP